MDIMNPSQQEINKMTKSQKQEFNARVLRLLTESFNNGMTQSEAMASVFNLLNDQYPLALASFMESNKC